jgi:hypothetical protein
MIAGQIEDKLKGDDLFPEMKTKNISSRKW